MGLPSRCQRSVLRVLSPRQQPLIKLTLLVLLLTVWLVGYHLPGIPNSTYRNDRVVQTLINNVQHGHHEVKLSQSLNEESHLEVTKTLNNNLYSTFKQMSTTDIAERVLTQVVSSEEQQKSQPHVGKNSVLSPKTIRIVPARPSLKEGDSLFLTCTVFDQRAMHNKDAPYLNFELPEMSYSLESEVIVSYINGNAILKVAHVMKGHEGVYRCVAVNHHNEVRYNTVEVRVQERPGRVIDHNSNLERNKQFYRNKDTYWEENDITALLERGKMQEKLVEEFCSSHNLSHQALQLSEATNDDTNCLYRHLLLNDKTSTLFCFVPKAGCTNLRVLFFVAQGLVPRTELSATRDKVNQELLEGTQYAHSFLSRSNTQKSHYLRHYYKFMMYRNPLERLLSGYRSKVERFPLSGLHDDSPHYNWLRKAVYAYTHPIKYQEYLLNGGAPPVNVSFSDFVDYWLTQPENLRIDEHFRSIFSLCQPCRTRFNFYGNFKNFNTDSQVLIKKIHSTPKFLRSGYYSSDSSTEALTQHYYNQLSKTQKLNIAELLRLDLEFYYHLFPGEGDVYTSVLNAL